MARRTLIVAVLALGGLGAFAGPAQATFHLMKVSEVMPGTAAAPNAEYVELQMYAPLQNFVATHKVTFYGPNSTPTGTCTFASDVANGQNQNTLLIATPAAQAAFSVGSDCAIADANRLDPAAGAACWDVLDCVAWGSITNTATLPSPVGTPAAAIPDTMSLTRSIAPGCPTLLEATDDTDNSAADFTATGPSPRPNSVAPTEQPCSTGGGGGPPGGAGDQTAPQTKISKGPKKRIEKSTVKVKFRATEPGSTFQCKLDRKHYKRCSSPHKLKRLDRGKHTFRVRAIDAAGNVDPTPAKLKFKVVAARARP